MPARPGLQERLESSDTGRSLISAFVIATVVLLVAINVPTPSYLQDKVLDVGRPFLNATGLDQTWRVFAADPRRTSLGIEARVRYADGTRGTWRLPQGSALLGNYWDYRWRKWMENAIRDSRRGALWRPAAVFVARQERASGRRPVHVTLVRRYRELRPPGARGPDRGRWQEYPYYRLKITPRVLGED